MYICASYVCSAHEGQKTASDLLEPELLTVVKCHMGTEPESSAKESGVLSHSSALKALLTFFNKEIKQKAFLIFF